MSDLTPIPEVEDGYTIRRKDFPTDTTSVLVASNRYKLVRKFGLDTPDPKSSILQNYRLIDQDVISRSLPIKTITTLLDPYEVISPIDSDERYIDLIELVTAHQKLMHETYGIHNPILGSGIDILIGNPDFPEECYRFNLISVESSQPGKLTFIALDNVEHITKPSDIGGDYVPSSTSQPRAFVNSSRFVPHLRTGEAIRHQRRPDTTSIWESDQITIDVDPEKDTIYLVYAQVK